MALKLKLSKADFEKLSDEVKKEYKANKDNEEEYLLDVDGYEDPAELRRAKEREVQARKDAEKAAKEANEKLAAIEGDDARKRGDIDTLEKSWKEKADKMEAEKNAVIAKRETQLKQRLVDSQAETLAKTWGDKNWKLLVPHIKSRLSADLEGDDAVTRILDKDGKVSAFTVDDLKTEFYSNDDFAGVLVASKASGGAEPENTQKRNGVSDDGDKVDLTKVPTKDLVAHMKGVVEANKQV